MTELEFWPAPDGHSDRPQTGTRRNMPLADSVITRSLPIWSRWRCGVEPTRPLTPTTSLRGRRAEQRTLVTAGYRVTGSSRVLARRARPAERVPVTATVVMPSRRKDARTGDCWAGGRPAEPRPGSSCLRHREGSLVGVYCMPSLVTLCILVAQARPAIHGQ